MSVIESAIEWLDRIPWKLVEECSQTESKTFADSCSQTGFDTLESSCSQTFTHSNTDANTEDDTFADKCAQDCKASSYEEVIGLNGVRHRKPNPPHDLSEGPWGPRSSFMKAEPIWQTCHRGLPKASGKLVSICQHARDMPNSSAPRVSDHVPARVSDTTPARVSDNTPARVSSAPSESRRNVVTVRYWGDCTFRD